MIFHINFAMLRNGFCPKMTILGHQTQEDWTIFRNDQFGHKSPFFIYPKTRFMDLRWVQQSKYIGFMAFISTL